MLFKKTYTWDIQTAYLKHAEIQSQILILMLYELCLLDKEYPDKLSGTMDLFPISNFWNPVNIEPIIKNKWPASMLVQTPYVLAQRAEI